MGNTVGSYNIDVVADTSGATSAINKLNNSLAQSANEAKESSAKVGTYFGDIGKIAGGMIAASGIMAAGSAILKTAGELEQAGVAMKVMLGDAATAQKLMTELRDMGSKTPFETTDLINASKTLITFGVAADEVTTKLTNIGNAAMGNAEVMKSLATAYGRMKTDGVGSLEELNKFTDAGVPILSELAKKYNTTTLEIKKMASSGKIAFAEIDDALTKLTNGTGQFAGMMDQQSQTLDGVLSTTKDNFINLGVSILNSLLPVLKVVAESLGALAGFIGNVTDAFPGLTSGLMATVAAGVIFYKLYTTLPAVINAVKIAMAAMSAMLASNPIGLILTAAAIAIGAIVAVVATHSEETKKLAEQEKTRMQNWVQGEANLADVMGAAHDMVKRQYQVALDAGEDNRSAQAKARKRYNEEIAAYLKAGTEQERLEYAARIKGMEQFAKEQKFSLGTSLSQVDADEKLKADKAAAKLAAQRAWWKEWISFDAAQTDKLNSLRVVQAKAMFDLSLLDGTAVEKRKEIYDLEFQALDDKLNRELDLAESKGFDTTKMIEAQGIERLNLRRKQADDEAKQQAEAVAMLATGIGKANDFLGATANLITALYEKQFTKLDEQKQKALEAAGLADKTAVESARLAYDVAVASGDATKELEAKNALDKAIIDETYEKKRQKLQYEANLVSWKMQVASATAMAAQATLNAWASTAAIPLIGVGLAEGAAALAALLGAVQIAAVVAAKPEKPKFATGGFIPGGLTSGDLVDIRANSGEAILNATQQRNFMALANGIGGGSKTINLVVDGKTLATVVDKERDTKAFNLGAYNYSYGSAY